ncbi:S1 RNA-binding domain-containing protein [Aggregatilineales bacterium SYSU G02658]
MTTNGKSENFADLLDQYAYAEPTRGQILSATVIAARRDEVIVDVGLKRDAVVRRADLDRLDRSYVESLKPGDEVQVYVMYPDTEDGDLVVSLNKALEREDWRRAQELMETDQVTEGVVIDSNKGGMLVQFGRLVGFIPNSHIESVTPTSREGRVKEIKDSMVGRVLQLKVIQVEAERNRLIMSERAARRATRSERLSELKVGSVVTGRVVNITDFGVFVDIGGVDGMVHISNLDHRHVTHPSDVVSIGDEMTVRIDAVDVERERIALNRKATLPDPWETFTAQYRGGDLFEGVVTNVVDFGVFVASDSGAQGLVHATRMNSLKATPRDMFKEGDRVIVKIVGMDIDRKHIELSIDDITEDERAAFLAKQNRPSEPEA